MDQAQVVVHSTRMAVQVLLRLRLLPCSVRARMRVRMLCISLVIDARNWVHDFGTQIVDKINQTNHRSSSAISFIALTHYLIIIMAHIGVTCDVCGAQNFGGIRYKCHVCFNYDLCEDCASRGATSNQHRDTHPMQQIPPPGW
jgi:hypothetical protein